MDDRLVALTLSISPLFYVGFYSGTEILAKVGLREINDIKNVALLLGLVSPALKYFTNLK